MGVCHFFIIVQMVPNRLKRFICTCQFRKSPLYKIIEWLKVIQNEINFGLVPKNCACKKKYSENRNNGRNIAKSENKNS